MVYMLISTWTETPSWVANSMSTPSSGLRGLDLDDLGGRMVALLRTLLVPVMFHITTTLGYITASYTMATKGQ